MTVTIDEATQVITVDQADLTFVTGTLYEMDTNAYRLAVGALLASERGRGADNEAFGTALEDYPFWYYTQLKGTEASRHKRKKGFDTNSSTRSLVFKGIDDYIALFEPEDNPHLKHEFLMIELAAAVRKKLSKNSKEARVDHPSGGTLDSGMAFGIGLKVYKSLVEGAGLVCNRPASRKDLPFHMRVAASEKPRPVRMGVGVSNLGGR